MVGTSRQRQGHKSCQQKLSPFRGLSLFSHTDKEQCTQHTHCLQKEVTPRQSLTFALPRDCRRVPPLWAQTSLGNVLVYPSLTKRQRRRPIVCPTMSAILGGGEATMERMRAGGVGLWKMAVIMHWHDKYDPMSLACPESAPVDGLSEVLQGYGIRWVWNSPPNIIEVSVSQWPF